MRCAIYFVTRTPDDTEELRKTLLQGERGKLEFWDIKAGGLPLTIAFISRLDDTPEGNNNYDRTLGQKIAQCPVRKTEFTLTGTTLIDLGERPTEVNESDWQQLANKVLEALTTHPQE